MSAGLPYNGWPEHVRYGRDKHYYHARTNGVLAAASGCHACGISFGDQPVPYHAEDYGPTLEDYWASCVPLCHRCHAMVHARFVTPNYWNLFLQQLADEKLDENLFPRSTRVAALLSKFGKRADIGAVGRPGIDDSYLLSLPMDEYSGSLKAATLRLFDRRSGEIVEVPDWTLYGDSLERLGDEEREALHIREIRIDDFLSGEIDVERKPTGERRYVRLYLSEVPR